MTNIVKATTMAINLSPAEREVVKAAASGSIIHLVNEAEIKQVLTIILGKLYYQAGHTIKGNGEEEQKKSLELLAASVAADLKEYFPTLTLAEVEVAFGRGIRQYYGEWYGLNVAQLHTFVRSYKHSEERTEALHKQKQHLLENQPAEAEPDKQQIRMFMDKACVEDLESYRKSGILNDYGGAKYDHLVERGLLQLTPERQAEYLALADEQIHYEHTQQQKGATLTTARQLHELFKSTKMSQQQSRAKYLALKDYYDGLLEMEVNLQDLLEGTV